MNMQDYQIADVIRLFPCLAEVSPEDWQDEGISIVSTPENVMVHEGEFLDKVALILDGSVRIYKLASNGREVTLFRVKSGEFCPILASHLLGGPEYEASACVEQPTTFLLIPAQIFQEWIGKHFEFRQFVLSSFLHRHIDMANLIEKMNFKSIYTRICEYLINHTTTDNDSLVITHDMLSIELGTAREVISRTLKAMENDGLLELKRGRIIHIQRNRLLKSIAE